MKICTVSQSFYPYVGGVSQYLLALGKRLVARGDEMIAVHLKTPEMPDFEVVDGIRVYRLAGMEDADSVEGYFKFKEAVIDITHGSGSKDIRLEDRFKIGYPDYLGFNIGMYEKIKEVYEKERFDILHVHDFQVLPQAFLLKGEVNVPMLFTWHIPFTHVMPSEWRGFMVNYMKYYDHLIFSTDEYVRCAMNSGLDPQQVQKINPFIEVEEYCLNCKNDFREKYGIPENNALVLCVSRIDPRKGQDYLIRAMKDVVARHPETTCVFIGNGSLTKKIIGRESHLEKLEALVSSLGLEGHVKFLGKVGHEDLVKAYDACDMLVQPSVNEGFGLVISEAMCFSRPVIGSDVGGIPEQVSDGVNGFLFKPRDHQALAERILTLVEHPAIREQMGMAGRDIVTRQFCVERGFKDHTDIYDSIYMRRRISDDTGAGESLLSE